jgi:prophage tail gpP-like protein
MSKPTPGKSYTVVKGDNLSLISQRAYGIQRKWRDIWQANQTVLKSDDPNLIFPGEVLFIPLDTEIEEVKKQFDVELADKAPDDFTIIINDKEVPVESGRVTTAIDQVADSWSARLAFFPKDPDHQANFKPFAYPQALSYLGGQKMVTGFLYIVNTELDDSRNIELFGWSQTAELVDNSLHAPFRAKNITLRDRIKTVAEPFGLPLIYTFTGEDAKFKRVKAGKTEQAFSHLAGLASQRSAIIGGTPYGEILVEDIASGDTVGTIEEGQAIAKSFKGKFDGRKRFQTYRALGKSQRGNKSQNVKDESIRLPRLKTFSSDDTTIENIQVAAEYKKNKAFADALSIPLPVTSWYAPNGELWRKNTLVTVKSETLFLPDGYTFLIRGVEYIFSPEGTTAMLTIVPPGVFNNIPVVNPWA